MYYKGNSSQRMEGEIMNAGTIQGDSGTNRFFAKKCAFCAACGACVLGWTAFGLFFIGLMLSNIFG